MQHDTIIAISKKLHEEFGSEYTVYPDAPEQNLHEPCFYICALHTEQVPKLGTACVRNQSFDIHYFPKEEEQPSKELSDVSERLYSCMEYIALDGKLYRGKERKAEVRDGVLHFMVDYNIPLRKPEEPDAYMEELTVEGMMK